MVEIQTGDAILPLIQKAVDAKLWNEGWEAIRLFQALLNGTRYHPYHGWTEKEGAKPKHIRFALMTLNNEPVAWVLQWLDLGYSITGEFWRFTKPSHRHKGLSRLLKEQLQAVSKFKHERERNHPIQRSPRSQWDQGIQY
jgi:hypothetical protein